MIQRVRRCIGTALRSVQSIALYRTLWRKLVQYRLTIREATDTDKLAVHRWLNPKGDTATALHRNHDVTELVAYSCGHLAGFVQLVRHPPEHSPYTGFWLFSLAVKPQWKGGGIGEKLTREVILKASGEGQQTLDLLVFNTNIPAIHLYQKLGFAMHIIPELEQQLAGECVAGRRRVVMRRLLNGPL
jgi:ribosomal protein S18 acetylase RimI-like enzyme